MGSGGLDSHATDSASSTTQASISAKSTELSRSAKTDTKTPTRRQKRPSASQRRLPQLGALFKPEFEGVFDPAGAADSDAGTGTRSHLVKRETLVFCRSCTSVNLSKELYNLRVLLRGSDKSDDSVGSALDDDSGRNLLNLIKSLELSFDDFDFVFEPMLPLEVDAVRRPEDVRIPFYAFWKVRVLNPAVMIDVNRPASNNRASPHAVGTAVSSCPAAAADDDDDDNDDGDGAGDGGAVADPDAARFRSLEAIDRHVVRFDVKRVSLRALYVTYTRGLARPGKPCTSNAGTSEVAAFDRDAQLRRGMQRGSDWLGAYNKQYPKQQFQAAKDARDAAGPSMELIETWIDSLKEPLVVG